MNKKCSDCGMVNWKDANECARCNTFLGRSSVLEAETETSSNSSFNGLRFGAILCFSLILFAGVYKFLDSGTVKSPTHNVRIAPVNSADFFKDIKTPEWEKPKMATAEEMKKAMNMNPGINYGSSKSGTSVGQCRVADTKELIPCRY